MAPTAAHTVLDPAICHRALDSRDARFDGVFFVGITSTNIYCRPICPARVSYPSRRRFFVTAGAAESAGYRPCLRCRPELAPGHALCDAVSQLARGAALRIANGALNGSTVSALARELGVSDRHLRRAMERELGVSPRDLAQTHRLLLAKRLLGETTLPVTRVAYASGFQSLRRFNAIFRDRYALKPSAVRRARMAAGDRAPLSPGDAAPILMNDAVRLSLGYRVPFAWNALLEVLRDEAVQGVEVVDDRRYIRTVSLDGHTGEIVVEDGADSRRQTAHPIRPHLTVALSPSLLPVLMPLLARLRRLFDLDAEPLVIDSHLAATGLRQEVRDRPGLRVPGALDGFEIALKTLVGGAAPVRRARLTRLVNALGAPTERGHPGLVRLVPDSARIAVVGESRLRALGVPARLALPVVTLAREHAAGRIALDPSADSGETLCRLMAIDGMTERYAHDIVMRCLHGPDAFPLAGRARTAGAERWRPWRAYAAWHLRISDRIGTPRSTRRHQK